MPDTPFFEAPIPNIQLHLPDAKLLRAAAWSLSGNVVPMVAAIAAVPFLLRALGGERMGVLSLVWVLVGYFNFLDMGLGRAVTVAVARVRQGAHADRRQELHILGTALVLLTSVATAVSLALAALVCAVGIPVAVSSPSLNAEVQRAFLWILPSLPLLLLAAVLRGHLEAIRAFRALNVVRIPTGVLLVAGPCLAAWYVPHLEGVCVSILLVRLAQALALLYVSAKSMDMPVLAFPAALVRSWSQKWLASLLSFGGWVTVSNVLGPVIVYADRFVLGTVVAASAVAIYAIPFDVVSRLPILTASLGTVLLPELVRLSLQQGTPSGAHALLKRSYLLSLLTLVPLVGAGWWAMPWVLAAWIDATFAEQASAAAQILLLAFAVNALSQIPFAAMQASGRVRALALLHAAELVPYLLLLWLAAGAWGVVGAAYACLARSCADFAALVWLWHRAAQSENPSLMA